MAEVHALDVGCGSGVHAQLLAEEGTRVTAFDGSPSAIDHGRVPHPHARIAYQVAKLLELDPNTGPFDLVIDRLSSIHTGVSGVTAFYQSLRTALAPDARLFWQGFDIENSGRSFGHYDTSINAWTGFSEIFYSLREAQIIIESWRKHYNTERPHSALGYRPPAPEAIVPMDQGPIMH